MPILLDPESSESKTLFSLFPAWKGKSVLEIGSGDGRLTWVYASKAARVVALEPDSGKYQAALADRPGRIEQLEFYNLSLDEFYSAYQPFKLSELRRTAKWFTETLRLRPSKTSHKYVQWSKAYQNKERFDLAILSWSL